MNTAISPRLAAGLAAIALLAVACGPVSHEHVDVQSTLAPIPALASGDGATASMGLALPAYPVPARVEYRVQGTLPTLPSGAAAYRLEDLTSTAAISRLASALGVTGSVSSDSQGWTATGSGSSLYVRRAAGLPWQLAQSGGGVAIGFSGCGVAVPARPVSPPGAPTATILPTPVPKCVEPTPVPGLPSRTEAEDHATSALRVGGLDVSGASVEASGGIGEWFVSIAPAVGGVPVTAAGWSVTVGPHDALLSASGWLFPPASAGDYPLVGVEAGLERLRAGGRWIVRGGPGPVPLLG
ncbi:MAG TPA: hypothetical protein VF112_08270, partial [Candidatus Dormibacteraeota bacterium]